MAAAISAVTAPVAVGGHAIGASRGGPRLALPAGTKLGGRTSSGLRAGRLSCGGNAALHRASPFVVKAQQEPLGSADTTIDTEQLWKDIKTKWDKIENKSAVALYAGGSVLLVWLSSAVVSAVDSIPLVPKLFELVGAGYSGWFIYRYLLFKSSRKELADTIDELKGKIAGSTGMLDD